jgi:hypothetical protein
MEGPLTISLSCLYEVCLIQMRMSGKNAAVFGHTRAVSRVVRSIEAKSNVCDWERKVN